MTNPNIPAEQPLPEWLHYNREIQKNRGEIARNKGAGWKLHLNFDSENPATTQRIQGLLESQKQAGLIVGYKIGHGGGVAAGQSGKEATVYVGSRDDATLTAQGLQATLGEILMDPHKDALRDDVEFTAKVIGRFESSRVDPDFAQYGAKGHALLKVDMANLLWDNENFSLEEARRRADRTLRERYGSYYTGGQDT